MKTGRENEIATCILNAGNMMKKPSLNVQPEGEYLVDGRRCDARIEGPNGIVFLEIFAGKDLSYMRDRMMMRDSRVFNRRLGNKNVHTMHLICNDEAHQAFNGEAETLVQKRLVSFGEQLDHYVSHSVRALPAHPTKKEARTIAEEILRHLSV